MSVPQQAQFIVQLIANNMSVESTRKLYKEYPTEYLRDIARKWGAMYCSNICVLPTIIKSPEHAAQFSLQTLEKFHELLCVVTKSRSVCTRLAQMVSQSRFREFFPFTEKDPVYDTLVCVRESIRGVLSRNGH